MGPVTFKQIAEQAGVSTAAVGYALNGRAGVSAATRERIIEVAQELGYTGNLHASSLRTGHSGAMALIVRDLSNPYFLDLIAGAQDEAAGSGVSVIAADSASSVERELAHVRHLAAQQADGLAIAPVADDAPIRLWQHLRPGRPVVAINVPQAPEGIERVGADRRSALTSVLDHLLGLGHRRIGFLELDRAIMADTGRRDIFTELTESRGLDTHVIEVGGTYDKATASLHAVLAHPRRPTAVIANSDYYALAVYQTARDLGLSVGGDLSVVGQDDLPTSRFLSPPLTTVRLDVASIGRALTERLILPGELPTFVAPVNLVIRESTGPAPLTP